MVGVQVWVAWVYLNEQRTGWVGYVIDGMEMLLRLC